MDNTRKIVDMLTRIDIHSDMLDLLSQRMRDLETKNTILEKNVSDLQEQLTKSHIRIKELMEELDTYRRQK